MRHLAWLFGLLLVVSCSVDPVQTVDGSGSGVGGGPGGHGGSPTGGGGTGAGGSSVAGSGGGGTGAGGSSVAGSGGGGRGGSGMDGGETCMQLESDYQSALTTARQCTPGATNQCQHLVDRSLSCPGCQEYVNDVTALNAIAADWKSQDCRGQVCPQIACINPGSSATCVTSSGTSGGPNAGASPGGSCVGVGLATTN